jgi:hypothetical protein
MTNEEVVRRYWKAFQESDFATLAALRHPEWTDDFPQSRERVRGHANAEAIAREYPGGQPVWGEPHFTGSEDRWVLTPSNTVERIAGKGDSWWADGFARYPDGSVWFVIVLLELLDGKVYRETDYYAPPFKAPEWRAKYVESMEEPPAG